GLLYAGIYGKWQAAHERPDPHHLPSRHRDFAKMPEERHAVRVQVLKDAERERALHIETGRAAVGAGIQRILRSGLRDRAGVARDETARYGAGVVDRLRERVACLKAEAGGGEVLLGG